MKKLRTSRHKSWYNFPTTVIDYVARGFLRPRLFECEAEIYFRDLDKEKNWLTSKFPRAKSCPTKNTTIKNRWGIP